MGIPENGRGPRHRRLEAGENVVAAGGHRLPGPGEAGRAEALDEVVADPASHTVGGLAAPNLEQIVRLGPETEMGVVMVPALRNWFMSEKTMDLSKRKAGPPS